jgi:hypothetical protein
MLTGNGVATAGLILGYMALIFLMAFTAFIFDRGATRFKAELESTQSLPTNPPDAVLAQPQTPTAGNETQHAQSNGAGWTLDIKDATIPAGPVSGQVHGADFQLKRALFRNGNLRFISEDGQEFLMIHGLGESVENKSFEFQMASGDDAPKVEIGWKDGEENQTATFPDGYAMELKFDGVKGRRLRGQIYLCLPDDSKSYIAGTFVMVMPKPKPKPEPAQ